MANILPARRCAYDGCCKFQPKSHNAVYCPEHKCKRKAESVRKRVSQEELFEQPREFRTLRVSPTPEGFKVLIINDLHRPFHDRAVLQAVRKFWADFVPDLEVYAGDISDLYTISRFDKNPSRRFKLKDELLDTRGFLFEQATANPGADRVWIDGNHEDRLRRWLWRFGEELNSLEELELNNLLRFGELGIRHLPYMSVVDLLGFRIEHGYKASASRAYPVNVSRYMAIATGSSGLCGHSHHYSSYAWTDARHSHSYIENGCLCRMDLDYAPFPNWQHAFTYGVVHRRRVHLVPVQIYDTGFHANGEFYPRIDRSS